jgi:AraC family transcriptional regulator
MDIGVSEFSGFASPAPDAQAFASTDSWALSTIRRADHEFWTLSLLLGASLLQHYARLEKLPEVQRGGLAPWQKRKATEYFTENLASNVRLKQVAKTCELSVSHFARSFKETFGVSAHRWLIQKRLSHAEQLLISTSIPLIDIALQSGFSDQASFTRTFTQDVGVSPGRWRKQQRD